MIKTVELRIGFFCESAGVSFSVVFGKPKRFRGVLTSTLAMSNGSELSDEVVNHRAMHVGQTAIDAVVAERELRVIDSQTI